MFWPFKRKKKFKPKSPFEMIQALYCAESISLSVDQPLFTEEIKKEMDFDPLNYSHNLSFLIQLYAKEIIRLNGEIETMKEIHKGIRIPVR